VRRETRQTGQRTPSVDSPDAIPDDRSPSVNSCARSRSTDTKRSARRSSRSCRRSPPHHPGRASRENARPVNATPPADHRALTDGNTADREPLEAWPRRWRRRSRAQLPIVAPGRCRTGPDRPPEGIPGTAGTRGRFAGSRCAAFPARRGARGNRRRSIAISLRAPTWIAMLRSGVMLRLDPSRCERKVTPSSG